MIINNNEEIEIKGSCAKIIQDITEIFCKLNGKINVSLKNNPSIVFRAYVQALNDCIKYAPIVMKEFEEISDKS